MLKVVGVVTIADPMGPAHTPCLTPLYSTGGRGEEEWRRGGQELRGEFLSQGELIADTLHGNNSKNIVFLCLNLAQSLTT
jgi:hypothetical protein